ncbi:MAG: citramalate synthase [Candidatus Cyclonatronum sp.]|uniref:citramalate synthase n=1 Tax=Cyclonatronum sp. TaxID=3024185 RepID=UPI0025B9BF50|nr:citramalate synthase [Cyclonatronum sp.]MCH8487157.1 citramalate synthase [Cyclonatronum sp.]
MKPKIDLFDTTLRDGTQGEGVSFSAEDKLRIARRLDAFGIDFIEGGWPGSNPRDMAFFRKAHGLQLRHARIVAFGSTCRGSEPAEDANLAALLEAETPAVSVFGKTWRLHAEQALGISCSENLARIFASVRFLKAHGKYVIYDAEHFFDGFADDPEYALATLKAAHEGGADVLTLCDTNGGSLPGAVGRAVQQVAARFPGGLLGIHPHNDGELAVANALAAVEAGCRHVQGTINGYGERCGNANLCSVIPNLQLKLGYDCIPGENLAQLTGLSHFVSELANRVPHAAQAFTGRSAFAHKGGVHVSAVMKKPETYEHITPETVGNSRRVLVSDLSGRSNIRYKTEELGIDLEARAGDAAGIVRELKQLEHEGYAFEAAEASLELLIRRRLNEWTDPAALKGFRILIEKNERDPARSEATIRLDVNGITEHTAAESVGPVHALDLAMRKALSKFFPAISRMHLSDYKVRVLNGGDGTRSKVRVLIESSCEGKAWSTVGVSENIMEASHQALIESYAWFLQQQQVPLRHPSPQPNAS